MFECFYALANFGDWNIGIPFFFFLKGIFVRMRVVMSFLCFNRKGMGVFVSE